MRAFILAVAATVALVGAAQAQTVDKLMVKGLGNSTFAREGELHLPAVPAGKLPIVLFMPGTDGIDQRIQYHRSALLAAGIGTMEIDTKTGIFKNERDRPENAFFEPIAFGALKALWVHPRVDPARIGVMGWSAGATTSISTAHAPVAVTYVKSGEPKFAAHVGMYGGCSMPKAKTLTGAPILIAYGTSDTHNPYSRCVTFKQTFSNVELVTYKDIHHGFDKEGIDRDSNGRIMRWNQSAAEDARMRVAAFFAKQLKAVPPS